MFSFFRHLGESVEWLLNLIGVIGYFWMLRTFLVARRRYNRRRRLLEVSLSAGSVAVAIGVGIHIENDVKMYLREHFVGKRDETDLPLVTSYYRPGLIPAGEMRTIAREIIADLNNLRLNTAISDIHLFYGGPCILGIVLGSVLGNWVPVHLYARDLEKGSYEYALTIDGTLLKGDD